MSLNAAKSALVRFYKSHEQYLETARRYQDYLDLPFWKKWFVSKVEKPRKDYRYDVCTIRRDWSLVIELRMYFSGTNKEITLAVNENNKGYKLNILTGEKSCYLGRVNPHISEETENLLIDIRYELLTRNLKS